MEKSNTRDEIRKKDAEQKAKEIGGTARYIPF